jgi:hypothetical protein
MARARKYFCFMDFIISESESVSQSRFGNRLFTADCDTDTDSDSENAFPAALSGSQNMATGFAGGYLMLPFSAVC